MRYLLVWDRMGHYHVARWRALQEEVGAANALAADLGAADQLYGWRTEWAQDPAYVRLSGKPVDGFDLPRRLVRFVRMLHERQVDVCALAGYGRAEYILMALYARLTGRKVILFAESWYGRGGWIDRAKGILLNVLTDGWLVSGVRAQKHFSSNLRINPRKIAIGYSVVDNAHFAKGRHLPKEQPPVLLSVARFAEEKDLITLVRAFAASTLPGLGWRLRLVGGGPQRTELERMQAAVPNLELANWRGHEDLPALYGQATAFILASTFEPWGLVVNEALAAGLPVICSDAVGAAPDLLGEGSPYVYPAGDQAALTRLLDALPTLPPDPEAEARLADFSPARWAELLVALADRS